ncbi:YwiC-like family protein, partial [Lysinibacillus sp. D4A1_S13]|uniref:YwiC-like family protein n=1 Tax=Lysinibacillus sp. D4A1_S13 TaxID=2941228 RepID=UPI0020BE5FB6
MKKVTYQESVCTYNEVKRRVSMKAMIPKQHGAWAMMLIRFLLGMVKVSFVFWHI